MTVRVVTDSTAQLPDALRVRHRIGVVALHLSIDGAAHRDGVDVTSEELADALGRRRGGPHARVTTSRCSPAELARAYTAAQEGDGVLAVHLSSALSGTWEAGRIAAGEAAGPVRLVDSRSTAMGLGFPVLAAARAAHAGADLDAVHAVAVDTAARCRTLLCVDTLEHLRRGGRVTAGSALIGGALAVKPLLHVSDGRIVPLEKVRTTARAVARLTELCATVAGGAPTAVAVHHLGAPGRATELARRLRERLPRITELHVSPVGAVVGAHLGPGMVGVVVCPGGAGGELSTGR